jgi:hypothetical protein
MSTAKRRGKGCCGCGCGLLVLLLGLLSWGGYVLIKGAVGEAKRIDTVMEQVYERHGRISDFRPGPEAALPPERVEAFLRVRELMSTARAETEHNFVFLSSKETEGATQVPGLLGQVLAWGMGVLKIEAGTNLVPQLFAFVAARGEALLEAGMGPGEYLYIYSLAFYSGLGKSPADGPAFRLLGDDEDGNQGRTGGDEFDVREGRREAILTRLNERLLPILRRQLAALDESGGVRESDPWRRKLAAEIAAMEADRFRIPWRDGLPRAIEASLEPYRARLEASYSATCNPLEVLAGMGEGSGETRAEEDSGS